MNDALHTDFTNVLPKESLRILAEADEHEVVKQVQACPCFACLSAAFVFFSFLTCLVFLLLQEFFADFYAINADLFTVNVPNSRSLYSNIWDANTEQNFSRLTDAIIASLLASKRRPASVRYPQSGTSDLCQKVAVEVVRRVKEEAQLFDFRRTAVVGATSGGSSGAAASATAPSAAASVGPVCTGQEDTLLLILNRRDDPVTPLLLQWTYQAMVHELLGIHNNRVDLSEVPGIRKELKVYVLFFLCCSYHQCIMARSFF